MATVRLVCPYCGHGIDATGGEEPVYGVRRRLKREYRAARDTCPECGNQYDLRQP